jgi:Predicted signal transduction protein with a C-terminal ATPase domain
MLRGITGGFVNKNNLYNFRKINHWKFYLVNEIPLMDMYRKGIIVIVLLAVIFIALTYLGLTFCNKIIYRSYKPLDNVVQAMNHVAEGQLDERINMKNVGSDFDKLANGFNYMMDEMKTLMEQVKKEQQQMDQIRFNALQSQIQPHFLYNALDSIHWQAMADGNKELSAFVKALAQYYRLCLSNGKDVICLEQEIEHVKNYLIIQNMRYDDIIDVQIEMEEDCKYTLIPKITLQPLVENSIYHGIKVKDGRGGQIKITVYKENDDVYVLVADNGTGMTTDQINQFNHSLSEFGKDSGYGIRNVNRRLQLLFGAEYGLHYDKNESSGVTVQVHLPSHEIMQCEEVL